VAFTSRIEVSSADSALAKSRRRSARGGNIALKSGKPAGVAINLANTSELLSLLDAAAPGLGGKVTILATGASSAANVNGKIVADRGTIDIRHTGDSNPPSGFTRNANYSSKFGGNDAHSGTFGGAGANNPLPLNQAPSLDGPGG